VEITEFIAVQFDEDEQWAECKHDSLNCDLGALQFIGECSCGYPARVLADIAAKRRILARHSSFDFPADEDDGPGDYAWTPSCDHCHQPWPCPDLLDLAAPFADRRGFRPEWRIM
jgi:hypothetical protein